jgi:hypothetical protein
MGLKGYRLWAMGQRDSNVQSTTEAPVLQRQPPRHSGADAAAAHAPDAAHAPETQRAAAAGMTTTTTTTASTSASTTAAAPSCSVL